MMQTLTIQAATPEQTGIPSDCIQNFIKRLKKKQVPMHSIQFLHQDKLIAEGYYAPYTAKTLHRMFSISKSVTSLAIGLLADEGKLHLEDFIVDYFPDKVPPNVHPWIKEMTIRHMLMMETCHASTTYKLDMTTDWVESFFTVPPTHPAGKLFHYDTSSAHTLCALVERLSGMPMLDYVKEKLAPLGLSNESYMLTDPFGVSMGGSGLVALPSDLLKLGYFIAKEGCINGVQLLSADYIRTATSNLTDTRMTAPLPSEACGYGYQIWQNEKGGWVCYGMGGQFIVYLPKQNFMMITTADTQGLAGGNQLIYDALYEEILPFICENPLPEDTKSHTALLSTLDSLQLDYLHGDYASSTIATVTGKPIRILDSSLGFSDMTFEFHKSTDRGIFHYTNNGECYSITFGLCHLEYGIFPKYQQNYAASGIWVTENTLYIRAHIIDAFVGSVHIEVTFSDDDVTVFLKKQEESLFSEFNGHLYGVFTSS